MYFNPRSPCGERRSASCLFGSASSISIHALLAESDGHRTGNAGERLYFNPRSPCGERRDQDLLASGLPVISIHALLAESDGMLLRMISVPRPFQSTLSLRRATSSPSASHPGRRCDFNPRSPCGERLGLDGHPAILQQISIHALLAESDHHGDGRPNNFLGFQSTLSLRRATMVYIISIQYMIDFNPRSPCGERRRTAIGTSGG